MTKLNLPMTSSWSYHFFHDKFVHIVFIFMINLCIFIYL